MPVCSVDVNITDFTFIFIAPKDESALVKTKTQPGQKQPYFAANTASTLCKVAKNE